MQLILDHITGVVTAAIVILAIAVTQFRSRDASYDATRYSAAKVRMLSVVEVMEQDIRNLGAGVDTAAHAIQGFDTTGTTRYLEFLGQTSQADEAVHVIRYEWSETGSVTLDDGSTIPTLTLERLIDGTVSGTSVGTITELTVDPMTRDSIAVTTNFRDTQIVAIELAAISPLGKGRQVEQTRWQKVFRPVNLVMR